MRRPCRDCGDLVVAQAALVDEVAVAGFGQPRRHPSLLHGARDRVGPARHRGVVENAERRAGDADRVVVLRGLRVGRV
jgi:hypothetical protein